MEQSSSAALHRIVSLELLVFFSIRDILENQDMAKGFQMYKDFLLQLNMCIEWRKDLQLKADRAAAAFLDQGKEHQA